MRPLARDASCRRAHAQAWYAFGLRPMRCVVSGSAGSCPSRGWGWWGRTVGNIGVSSRRSSVLYDKRCPSGLGWGSGIYQSVAREGDARGRPRADGWARETARACARMRLAAKHASPWPVKPRLAAVRAAVIRSRRWWLQSLGEASRRAPRAAAVHAVSPRRGRRAQARFTGREPGSPGRDGDRAIRGCARGLCWLQKSTSGARSSRKAMGLVPLRSCVHRARWHRGRKRVGSRVAVARATSTRAATPVAGSSRSHVRQANSTAYDRGREHSFDGRRPDPARAVAFDEAAGKAGSGGPDVMGIRLSGQIHGGSRQRASEAASQARRTVENTVPGRHCAEGPSIVAPPGPRRAAHVDVRGRAPARASGRPFGDHVMVATRAEAGGSPSSEAPPGRRIR